MHVRVPRAGRGQHAGVWSEAAIFADPRALVTGVVVAPSGWPAQQVGTHQIGRLALGQKVDGRNLAGEAHHSSGGASGNAAHADLVLIAGFSGPGERAR